MEKAKEVIYKQHIYHTAKWICPYCNAKNEQGRILMDRWKCWKCKRYSLKK